MSGPGFLAGMTGAPQPPQPTREKTVPLPGERMQSEQRMSKVIASDGMNREKPL